MTTIRLNNDMYPFACIFCKEIHKDKNMTSYNDLALLKIYPMWENSNHGKLHKIVDKYGKVY